MSVTTVEQIASSQFSWGILFILLGIATLTYLSKQNKHHEERIEKIQLEQKEESKKQYKELKKESREREDRLFKNLDNLTEIQRRFADSQEQTAKSIEGLNKSFIWLRTDHEDLKSQVEELRKDGGHHNENR